MGCKRIVKEGEKGRKDWDEDLIAKGIMKSKEMKGKRRKIKGPNG